MLTQIAACGELFHTATGTAFADLLVDGHRESWPIRSKRFRGWLRRRHYEATGGALNGHAISSELDLLEARAQFDAPERCVHVRIAEHEDHIYLDLADEQWRAVEIGPDGWQVIKCPPVRFRRPAGILPLPVPEQGGSIEALLPLLNLSSRNDFVLVVAWLLAALRPGGPYPVLAISGEQGSAKTVLSKMLKALVDPNAAPVRALPREERDLMIAANNGFNGAPRASFGANSRSRAPASWARCLMQQCVGCRHCLVFVSLACLEWQTSPCGRRLAEQPCGPLAPLRALMMRTA